MILTIYLLGIGAAIVSVLIPPSATHTRIVWGSDLMAPLQGDRQAGGSKTTPTPQPSPNIERYGLGKERTAIIVFGSACEDCLNSVEFYRSLLALPGMDGTRKRLVVLASDGVSPVGTVLDNKRLKPHRLVSYPRLRNPIEIPDQPPAVMVVDGAGVRLGLWTGFLTPARQKEVLSALAEPVR